MRFEDVLLFKIANESTMSFFVKIRQEFNNVMKRKREFSISFSINFYAFRFPVAKTKFNLCILMTNLLFRFGFRFLCRKIKWQSHVIDIKLCIDILYLIEWIYWGNFRFLKGKYVWSVNQHFDFMGRLYRY